MPKSMANDQAKKNSPEESTWAELREAQSNTLVRPNIG
jgi:hypothetical protein